MKKRVFALLLILLMACFALTACGEDDDDDDTSSRKKTRDKEVTEKVTPTDKEEPTGYPAQNPDYDDPGSVDEPTPTPDAEPTVEPTVEPTATPEPEHEYDPDEIIVYSEYNPDALINYHLFDFGAVAPLDEEEGEGVGRYSSVRHNSCYYGGRYGELDDIASYFAERNINFTPTFSTPFNPDDVDKIYQYPIPTVATRIGLFSPLGNLGGYEIGVSYCADTCLVFVPEGQDFNMKALLADAKGQYGGDYTIDDMIRDEYSTIVYFDSTKSYSNHSLYTYFVDKSTGDMVYHVVRDHLVDTNRIFNGEGTYTAYLYVYYPDTQEWHRSTEIDNCVYQVVDYEANNMHCFFN